MLAPTYHLKHLMISHDVPTDGWFSIPEPSDRRPLDCRDMEFDLEPWGGWEVGPSWSNVSNPASPSDAVGPQVPAVPAVPAASFRCQLRVKVGGFAEDCQSTDLIRFPQALCIASGFILWDL